MWGVRTAELLYGCRVGSSVVEDRLLSLVEIKIISSLSLGKTSAAVPCARLYEWSAGMYDMCMCKCVSVGECKERGLEPFLLLLVLPSVSSTTTSEPSIRIRQQQQCPGKFGGSNRLKSNSSRRVTLTLTLAPAVFPVPPHFASVQGYVKHHQTGLLCLCCMTITQTHLACAGIGRPVAMVGQRWTSIPNETSATEQAAC